MTRRELEQWLRKNRTHFVLDDFEEDDVVSLSTREHGSVGYEQTGQEDIREAKKLLSQLRNDFPHYKWSAEAIDEWVSITGRYSPKGSIKHLSAKELVRLIKKKYPSARKAGEKGISSNAPSLFIKGVELNFQPITHGGLHWQVKAREGHQSASAETEAELFRAIDNLTRKHMKASDLKSKLIRLGSRRKDLRPHIRPVLAELNRQASGLDYRVQMIDPDPTDYVVWEGTAAEMLRDNIEAGDPYANQLKKNLKELSRKRKGEWVYSGGGGAGAMWKIKKVS